MTLEINSIIYVLNPSPPKLIPGKVIEQIISRKVEGEIVTHIVSFSNGKNYTLEKIEKPWFTSLEKARLYLIEEANKLVDSVLEEGSRQTKIHFKKSEDILDFGSPAEQSLSDTTPKNIEEDMVIDLGNGKKAKVKILELNN